MMRLFQCFLLVVAFIFNITHANQCYPDAQSAYQALLAQERAAKAQKSDFVVNINTAHPSELVSLKGVGVKTAQAIVDYRELMGEFKTVDDLTKVKGVGQKTVDNNRHRLTVH